MQTWEELIEEEKKLGIHNRAMSKLRVMWVNTLRDMVSQSPEIERNKSGSPMVSDIDVVLASLDHRIAALKKVQAKYQSS